MPSSSSAKAAAVRGLLTSIALWPLGFIGLFFLFFGHAHDHRHDPRDALVPWFFALLFIAGSAAVGLVRRSWRDHPAMSVGAVVVAAPWLLLSSLALVLLVVRALHR